MKRKLCFYDLPNDIQNIIYEINYKRKHKILLNKCFEEMKDIKNNVNEYINWVINCVGISLWEHNNDFKYWLELEYLRDIKKKKYYIKLKNICKKYSKDLLYKY